jgi:sarcosine oxidase
VTPDFAFLVDTLPGVPNVVVVSACSGHGFKHAPAIGEAAAALALGRQPSVDLSAFGLGRLGLA